MVDHSEVAAQHPNEGAGEKKCDLVMKGGITSGVVYPSAVLKLKQEYGYSFRNIGGASAGAIAAVVTAAAEYGSLNRNPRDGKGYDALQHVVDQLAKEGFLLGLFQPAPEMRTAFDLLIAALKAGNPVTGKKPTPSRDRKEPGPPPPKGSAVKKAAAILKVALPPQARAGLTGAGAALAAWFVLGVVAWAVNLIPSPNRWTLANGLLVAGTSVLLAAIGGVAGLVLGLVRTFKCVYQQLPSNGFGLCPGRTQSGFHHDGLTDWLHEQVQLCAGPLPARPCPDRRIPSEVMKQRPLTFGDLEDAHVDKEDGKLHLETMTTNLTYSRPFRLPFEETGRFLFKPDELLRVFPEPIVGWMVCCQPKKDSDGHDLPAPPSGYFYVPSRENLPIVVGARMSLSFPVLFSAVPLYSVDPTQPEGPLVRNWFSDGGISSNFPIHFFDGWLPGRPTFGLSLGPYPTPPKDPPPQKPGASGSGGATDDWATGDVFMPVTKEDGKYARWTPISSLGGFIAQIVDTMENWRDNMQSELPGFRERVCEIRLYDDQGGLHLTMPPERISDLISKGRKAADRIGKDFNWKQHLWTRYLMLMETFKVRMEGDKTHPRKEAMQARFEQFYRELIEQGPPDVPDYRAGHDPAWCVLAARETERLLQVSEGWVDPEPGIPFDLTPDSVPAWVMRLTPKV